MEFPAKGLILKNTEKLDMISSGDFFLRPNFKTIGLTIGSVIFYTAEGNNTKLVFFYI